MNYLILGLGNIGKNYELTRHNIGFMVLDYIARFHKLKFENNIYAKEAILLKNNYKVYLVKPTTFMNLSGKAASYYIHKLKIAPENFLVVMDDIAFDLGVIKLRSKGSCGGHNGLRSIEESLKTQDYSRLRIGIGKDFAAGQQAEYVLSQFNKQELEKLPKLLSHCHEIVATVILKGLPQAMNIYNKRA